MKARALSLFAAATLGACTLFDEPPPSEGGAGATSVGGSGDGGGAPAGCTIESPRCLLPELEGVKLCSLVASCDELAASVALSTGLPLAVLDIDGARVSFTFSACVDWLTTPLEGAHAGFEAARAAINCMAATSTCAEAKACLSYEIITPDDQRCDAAPAGPNCQDDALVDCDVLEVVHCDGVSFPVTSHCEQGETGMDLCRVGSCADPGTACEENPPGTHYAIACTTDGDEIGIDCTTHGLGCTPDVGCSSAQGVAPACDVPFSQECAGPFVSTCTTRTPGGLDATLIDCSKIGELGAECVSAGQTARCGTTAAECTPYDAAVNVCDGDALDVCVGGAKKSFDCASIGLVCADAEPGLSGRCALP